MYTLSPGYRVPALQRGLSPAEVLVTKANALAAGAVLASAVITPPPPLAFAVVAAVAALINIVVGRRSVARWAAVGVRHLTERRTTRLPVTRVATRTWTLYPHHGAMQDPVSREVLHAALARALTFAGGQARGAGIQIHITHHATIGAYTDHTQTVSVHIPRGLVGHPERVIDTIAAELGSLGSLEEVTPGPAETVKGRTGGWVALADGRYVATARITAWPDETDGDMMPRLLLGAGTDPALAGTGRALGVLYRPLPATQSRRSAMWARAASGAFVTDSVKADQQSTVGATTHDALVQGACLVDVDAYLTVWADTPEAVIQACWDATLTADRHRMGLDWLTGQQTRAHVMTTPYGARARKGAVL
ncbi:hypothetical protein ABT160_33020 [Streptomyces sp. NPDC001941]|uniref:hypothetical protein n=1 Tax=Streptomyces sp. NPDC001941 TaxID=3154659 RepID=UPI00332D7ACB